MRAIARRHRELPLPDLAEVLASPCHEHRQAGLFVLADRYRRAAPAERETIAGFYLQQLDAVNSWDLVDESAPHILGAHLLSRDRAVLYELARSGHLWRQRIAVLATFRFIKAGQFDDTLRLAELLRDHPHDLIHKAVGWMLREVGKRDRRSRSASSIAMPRACRAPCSATPSRSSPPSGAATTCNSGDRTADVPVRRHDTLTTDDAWLTQYLNDGT